MCKRRAWFRFYEELNDFLPVARKKVAFPYPISTNQSVKDAVEAIGVPHTEIDMILVNGSPVDFSYRLADEDHVSVYPQFESLDITGVTSLRPKPLRDNKFIPDVHLGKLAKYLRLCGFDTTVNTSLNDAELTDRAVAEKRIILTRDRGLLKNRKVTHGFCIRSQMPKKQLEEVFRRFNLKNSLRPFTRCMECNSLLVAVEKNSVSDRLQSGTRLFFDHFKECQGCGRIYWEGSHYERLMKLINDVVCLAGSAEET